MVGRMPIFGTLPTRRLLGELIFIILLVFDMIALL